MTLANPDPQTGARAIRFDAGGDLRGGLVPAWRYSTIRVGDYRTRAPGSVEQTERKPMNVLLSARPPR
jgi:hypothetical protein